MMKVHVEPDGDSPREWRGLQTVGGWRVNLDPMAACWNAG